MPGRSNPKLRSSCDGCGAAKLKCDRGQPECGRCVSYGMQCVYGFSRKMGKPPRERLRQNAPPQPRRPSTDLPEQSERAGTRYEDKLDGSSSSKTTSAANNGTSVVDLGRNSAGVMLDMDLGSFPSVADVPVAWDTVEENSSTNGLMVNLNDTLDGLYSFTPVDFTSLGFTEWDQSNDLVVPTNSQFGAKSIPTPESPELSSYASSIGGSTNHSTVPQNHTDADADDEFSVADRALMPPPGLNPRDHDCPREAYGILGSLSFGNVVKSHVGSEEGSSSIGENGNQVPSDVPLDHILRLTRDASERLGHLLHVHVCSCPRSPPLALLYASIISRILTWYQQAADCTQNASWSPTHMVLDAVSQHLSPAASSPISGSGSTTGGGSCTWSHSAPSTFSTANTSTRGTPPHTPSTGLAVATTKMAIGSFNIDDLHVQTALKIQLLLGEMRRVACLIEQFIASHSSAAAQCGAVPDKSTFAGVDSLYLSLDSWLKSEQARIANMMRSKLRELNT